MRDKWYNLQRQKYSLYGQSTKEKAPLIECFVIYFFNTSDSDSKTP